MNRAKIVMLAAEVVAVAVLRTIYLVRKEKVLPRGAKVTQINGRPVFRMGKTIKEIEKPPEPGPEAIPFDEIYQKPPRK